MNANGLATYLDDLEANLRSTAPPVTEPGVYRRGGKLYKVQLSKTSGLPYAKADVDGRWEYQAGAIYSLCAADRLTLEQAKAIGKETGVCVMCSRDLSDPVSIAGGIGPVCEKRWYGSGSRKARASKKYPPIVPVEDDQSNDAEENLRAMEQTPPFKELVFALEDAESAVSYHYRDCFDQEEKYGCNECRSLNEARYRARKAMEADPAAKEYYESAESRERRRWASREYLASFRDDYEDVG
jgi:hypothetical protein